MNHYASKKFLFNYSTRRFILLVIAAFGVIAFSSALSEDISSTDTINRDSWMSIWQDGKKIGYSNTRLKKIRGYYEVHETVFMRINTMGVVQDISMVSDGTFNADFSLSTLNYSICSGKFQFKAAVAAADGVLSVITYNSSGEQTHTIPLESKPYLVYGMMTDLMASHPEPGNSFTYNIFDPATLEQKTVHVKLIGQETVHLNMPQAAMKVALDFKGNRQYAWLDDSGTILKQSGILGLEMKKTTREDAVEESSIQSSSDLTYIASIESNVVLSFPDNLNRLVVKFDGVNLGDLQLHGGRQVLHEGVLTIEKETIPKESAISVTGLEAYLAPTPFIQSNHPMIRNLTDSLITDCKTVNQKAETLMQWVYRNIEKKPVLSVPNALSTLENRAGDCNEHAMLLAALAQSAGIPVKVEVGLVYLKKRFYYHAWNSLFVGKWITADALLGQMPADVTHIRFFTGIRQMDLMGIIGKFKLELVEFH